MKNYQTSTPFDPRNLAKGHMTYCDLLETALRDPGKEGCQITDLLTRTPILRILKDTEVDDEIQLNHEQWTLVNELFTARKWPVDDGVADVAIALVAEMEAPSISLVD